MALCGVQSPMDLYQIQILNNISQIEFEVEDISSAVFNLTSQNFSFSYLQPNRETLESIHQPRQTAKRLSYQVLLTWRTNRGRLITLQF